MLEKRRIAAVVAEFLGTGALTLLVLSVVYSQLRVSFFVGAAAGLTVALMVFAVGRLSGGYFNPALTIGFWTARKLSTVNAVLYILAQFLGAWLAYCLYSYLVKNALQPIGGHFDERIMVAEVVGTALFGFAVAAAVYQGFNRAATASFAGLGLMLGIIAASSASLGILNPAVALGLKAWVLGTYVLGPIIGAIIGVNLYALLFAEPAKDAAKVVAAPAKAAKKKTSRAKK